MNEPSRDDERRALEAFRREIEAYCNRANGGGRIADGTLLTISVSTAWEPTTQFRREVHRSAHQTVDALLPEMRVGHIELGAARGLEDARWAFRFQPPALVAGFAPVDVTLREGGTAEEMSAPEVAPVRLVVGHGRASPWRYLLPPDGVWAPMGRWPDADGDRWGLRFPSDAGQVPRGKLLYVRQRGHDVDIHRSRQRVRYRVRVDGVPLRPGQVVPLRAVGSIEYAADGASSTLLSYQVVPEDAHDQS